MIVSRVRVLVCKCESGRWLLLFLCLRCSFLRLSGYVWNGSCELVLVCVCLCACARVYRVLCACCVHVRGLYVTECECVRECM